MRVWYHGDFINVELGQAVVVGRCGSGRTVFGETATFSRVSGNALIFVTESGAIVKTKPDALNTIGKAREHGYFVRPDTKLTESPHFIKSRVYYWNSKKCCIEYK